MTLPVDIPSNSISEILEPLVSTSQALWDAGQTNHLDGISGLVPQYLAATQSLLLFTEQSHRLFDSFNFAQTSHIRNILQILVRRRENEYAQLAQRLNITPKPRVSPKVQATSSAEFCLKQAQYLKDSYKMQQRLFQSAAWSMEALGDLKLAKLFQDWAERLMQDYKFLDVAVERFRTRVAKQHPETLN